MAGKREKSGLWALAASMILLGILFLLFLDRMGNSPSVSGEAASSSVSQKDAISQDLPLEEAEKDQDFGSGEDGSLAEQDDLWILFDNLKFSRQEVQPRIIYYSVILILYILFLGPVGYFTLKRLDRLEWMWIYIPVLAVAFSCWIVVSNDGTRLTRPDVDSLTVLSPQQENVVYVASTSPGRDSYELLFDSSVKEVQPLYMGGEFELYGDSLVKTVRPYSISERDGKIVLRLNPQSAFTRDYFRLDLMGQEEQALDVQIQVSDGSLEGSLVNDTQYGFAYLMLYYQEQYSFFTEVENGGTVLHIESTDWKSIYNPESARDGNSGDTRDNMKQVFSFAYEKYFMDGDEDKLYVAGMLPEYNGALDEEDKNLVSRGLYYQWVELPQDGTSINEGEETGAEGEAQDEELTEEEAAKPGQADGEQDH